MREARVASTLTHPNAAVVYDVGEDEQGGERSAYVAMEYVKGQTLSERLKQGRMDATEILKVAEQVAEALADAHEHGIVHRDVKPGNVMLTERGVVKVLDFGLARFAPPAHEDSLTWSGRHGALEGMIVGTLAYMSPEQARGHPVDARSDVFSLGVVLYEMLAGRVGRELGVRGVVSGGYQGTGDRIRVTARLSETATGRVLLHPQVDGAREAIFELQDRLVAEIVEGLRQKLPAGASRPEETHSLAAYEAFAKGLLNLQAESQEALERATLFFERAIALDPGYARAHLMLGATLDLKGDFLATPELSERALVSLDRALALRPDWAEVWRYRGGVFTTLGRGEEALAAFELALSLNPMDASAQSGIGRVHFILHGDFARAVPAYERALALNPRAGWSALQLAHCATLLRDFPKAVAAARRALELQQAVLSGRAGMIIVGAHMRLGHIAALQGRERDALAEYAQELEFVSRIEHALRGRIFIELQQRIGEAHLRLGESAHGRAALDLALEALDRRMRSGVDDPMSPYYGACAHALRGESALALDCLERAAAKRPRLTAARAALEPALESLRDEPRFRALASAAATARSSPQPPLPTS